MASLSPLPIDEVLEQVLQALRAPPGSFPALVLEAAPGAGKTTRVPWALAEAGLVEGTLWVTEPRRLAAKMSAMRVASEQGDRIGGRVGYSVRFDERVSRETSIIYSTEGLLLRRMLEDPLLLDVGAIVFDEVHERSRDLDLLLALGRRAALQRSRRALRPLTLVAMSATLDAARLAEYLGQAPRVSSAGRLHPLQVEHLGSDERPLEIQVRSAVRRLLDSGLTGDVLVFLPGQAEIRRSEAALGVFEEFDVLPLYGELPLESQVKAIEPHAGAKRRLILATNIAETSVTVPGVRAVIDTGLARVARYDGFNLVQRLETAEVSQARLTQRAGRAGRTAPGRVLRLFSKANEATRPESDMPELLRASVAEPLLLLARLGLSPSELDWLDPPTDAQWRSARAELELLGALDSTGKATPLGLAMARFPLPLRLARMLAAADADGIAELGALAAAVLSERDVLVEARGASAMREAGPSDLLDRIERIEEVEAEGVSDALCRRRGLSATQLRVILKLRDQLLRLTSSSARAYLARGEAEKRLGRALLTAFWDRLAERRAGGRSLVTTLGVTAELDSASVITDGRFLLGLAWDVPDRGDPLQRSLARRPIVRLGHRVEPDLVFDVLGDRVEAREEYVWNPEAERVEVQSGFYLGVLALDQSRGRASPCPPAALVLARALEAKGPKVVDPGARLEALRVRLGLLIEHCGDVFSDEEERERLRAAVADPRELLSQALRAAGELASSLEEVLKIHLDQALAGALSPEVGEALRRHCPPEVRLPSGRVLAVHYEEGKPPWIESRLQDFFSLRVGPRILQGRLPLSLHLLAPNHRPVQVTTDLEGFWVRHYPSIRKELMRKCPRHLWPEDGLVAAPPTPGKIR